MPASSRPPTRQRVDHPPLAAGPGDDARFAAWLQRTREAERAALARELHDELGAILTAARLDAAWLSAQPASHEPAIAQRLAALQQVLTQGIELKRRIIDDLHPTILTHLGLLAALGSACWFTGFATAPVALVRVVGQVEVLFTLGFSRLMLREPTKSHEVLGLLLVTAGVVLALLGALG